MTDGFIDSLFITIPATIIPIMVAAFAAYAFAWMDFPGRASCSSWWSACWSSHPRSSRSCSCRAQGLNMAGSFLSVWLVHTAYGLPFAIFLLRNFMGDLPKEVFESSSR